MKAAFLVGLCAWATGSALYFAADDKKAPPAAVKVAEQQPKETDDIEAALDRRVRAEFSETPLSQCLAFLAVQSGIRIHIDNGGLANAMVDRETPITSTMQGVRLGLLLDLLLEPLNLDYAIRENVLFVSSRERINEMRDTAVIRVGDVLPAGEAAPESAERIVALITENIDRDAWIVNGGDCNIQFVPDARSMVVTASSRTQRKITKLLSELRSAKVAQGLPANAGPVAAR